MQPSHCGISEIDATFSFEPSVMSELCREFQGKDESLLNEFRVPIGTGFALLGVLSGVRVYEDIHKDGISITKTITVVASIALTFVGVTFAIYPPE